MGFTLIEILVVIAIIAILATLAFPRIKEYRIAATVSKLQNNARICLTSYAAQEAMRDYSHPVIIKVPTGCTGNISSCTCSDTVGDTNVSVTCSMTLGEKITCSVSTSP